ncbi:MAG: primary-amine oxidase [Gammaproteobacteria bacterium]|nr:primary-amine oxidase [Gammaproteobacteria bacterium]
MAHIHPLDPFTVEELQVAVKILSDSNKVSEAVHFAGAFPVEPPKKIVRRFVSGTPFDREVRLRGYDREHSGSFDAHISLTQLKLISFEWVSRGHSPLSLTDYIRTVELVKDDPAWQTAMRKRGIEDLSLVQVDPWPAGGFPPSDVPEGTRVMRAISFLRKHPKGNGYARPIEGVMVYVDLENERVFRVDDYGVVPIPTEDGDYDAASVDRLREDLRPIEITQPEGPSFTVEGYAVEWQKWSFRVSLHPTQGLVLHQLGYQDDGQLRSILYRASLSDMVVPYGDVSPMHSWKHALDGSEANMGQFVNSLKLGCDCIGEIQYFDAVLLGSSGEPFTVSNAICMHEEDYGILWKHTDLQGGTVEVRRSRRLVISAVHTVGNYEYGFFWYLYMDGTIQMEVKLTGIVGVSAVTFDGGTDTAPLIAPQLASPVHQHLFCFRLDFEVDGAQNSIVELNIETDPIGPENPHGTVFRCKATPLTRESAAKRNVDPARSRSWKVMNPGVSNQLGVPVAYKLTPQGSPTMLAHNSSPHARRAGFAKHNLWVTPYSPNELAAAGEFTNLHPGGTGLPEYTAADRSIENTDLVVWHTVGLTHVPRPEDWPVMPVEYCGFMLQPVGFFNRNPALDVPPPKHCENKQANK